MKALLDIGLSDVKAALIAKGYETFTQDGVPNIVSVRNALTKSNTYNDRVFVWWEENGNEEAHIYTISTHPGFYYLQNPIAGSNGTAILVPGQYKDTWLLGMHRNIQFALCQRAGEVSVYRDNNRDQNMDCDPKTITKGYFGIDLHHGNVSDSDIVDRWSAGCQVWRYAIPHEDLMAEFKRLSTKYNFNKFSYTLLEQKDFQ